MSTSHPSVPKIESQPNAFNHARFLDLILLSGLFGRAMKGLVLAAELRDAQHQLQDQYKDVSHIVAEILKTPPRMTLRSWMTMFFTLEDEHGCE